MRLFALTTIMLSADLTVPAESEFELADAVEGQRLIAIGAAVDPDQRIAMAPEGADAAVAAVAAERDAVKLQLLEAAEANDAFKQRNDELLAQLENATAALTASHAEIASLTSKLADASKTIAKLEKNQK